MLKVLINMPEKSTKGGVVNHFLGVRKKFKVDTKYNHIGGRNKSKLLIFYQIYDYIKFLYILITYKPDIVHLNPSLDRKATLRDGLFLILAKLLNNRVLVFWHGWKKDFENIIDKNYINLFYRIFNKADAFCVLSSEFKTKLRKWGIDKQIYIETTKVNNELLSNFDINNKKINNKILFLARIEKYKGVYTSIKALENNNKCELYIAGTGSELQGAKNYVKENRIKNVNFLGYVTGKKKINILRDCSIYILPTDGEGMPTSMLEAMAFGLSIITRPVGGIKDFFEDGKMGYITDSKDPKVYNNLIKKLINNKTHMKKISKYNNKYARNRFLATKVAKRLEKIYQKVYYDF